MQDFRDNEKKNKNDRMAAILNIITATLVMGYPCVRHFLNVKKLILLYLVFPISEL